MTKVLRPLNEGVSSRSCNFERMNNLSPTGAVVYEGHLGPRDSVYVEFDPVKGLRVYRGNTTLSEFAFRLHENDEMMEEVVKIADKYLQDFISESIRSHSDICDSCFRIYSDDVYLIRAFMQDKISTFNSNFLKAVKRYIRSVFD